MLVCAVDGGGTKTHGILADETGHIVAAAVVGPCNLSNMGAQSCTQELARLLDLVCGQAGVTRADVTHAFLALGGLDTDSDRREYMAVVSSLFAGLPTKWQVENDVLAALLSGTWGEPGMVLLAGTGSMAMGLDVRNLLVRVGGWGFMVGGDPGSAFNIGRRLLRQALRDYDAGLAPNELTLKAMATVGVQYPTELVDWVEAADSPPSAVAQLARVVAAAAAEGNVRAAAMLDEAAEELVAQFRLLQSRLDFGDMQRVPVVTAGGMFRSTLYLEKVMAKVAAAGARWKCVVPAVPPVGGAFVGALRLAEVAVEPEVMRVLARELADRTERGA